VRLIAVGDRQPAWVDAAFSEYSARLPRQWRFRVDEIATAQRAKGGTDTARDAEAARLLARLKPGEFVVLLDEKGRQFTSRAFAVQLEDWLAAGQDLAFVIGGPDGVAASVGERANVTWSLSKLTLPHGLARVLFAEQIYRAWSLTTGHPYHRD